jgi:predicted phosphodiesterase
MRIAVFSDVHANLEALEAVLARARDEGTDATYVLGDIVGYNADPQAVVDRLAALPEAVLLAGNHDLAATERFDVTWFNTVAAEAIRWTIDALDADALKLLAGLEPRRDTDAALLVHGSVMDPASEYVVSPREAGRSFDAEPFDLCLFGHTHLPMLFSVTAGGVQGHPLDDGQVIRLEPGARAMLNPGSVGQPRDADPRASFMVLDTGAREAVVHRVTYDVESAQAKVRAAGLPAVLADRLAIGR